MGRTGLGLDPGKGMGEWAGDMFLCQVCGQVSP